VAMLKNIDGLLPGGLLLIIDLPQIKNRLLDDFTSGATFVFDDAPIAVLLAILLSRSETQKHNGELLCTD
jgi:hypothetical protein